MLCFARQALLPVASLVLTVIHFQRMGLIHASLARPCQGLLPPTAPSHCQHPVCIAELPCYPPLACLSCQAVPCFQVCTATPLQVNPMASPPMAPEGRYGLSNSVTVGALGRGATDL